MDEVCGLHTNLLDTVNRIEEKLDDSIVRLEGKLDGMIANREVLAISVAKVQKTIDNGIRADIKEAIRVINLVGDSCKTLDARLVPLEAFSWFREWVTSMRTDLFKNAFKLVCIAILAITLFHASDTVIKEALKAVLK